MKAKLGDRVLYEQDTKVVHGVVQAFHEGDAEFPYEIKDTGFHSYTFVKEEEIIRVFGQAS